MIDLPALNDFAKGFAVGFSAHLLFDIATYVLAVYVGIKIGCRKHKH
jgi:hypothetical protein